MRCRHTTVTVSDFHTEAPQATANEGLAQGPYVAARARFEPATLRTKGDESINEPQRPTICVLNAVSVQMNLRLKLSDSER